MSMFRVLHISDIHIGDTYKASADVAIKIVSDMEFNGLYKINAVVITGDIFDGPSGCSEELLNEAVIF